jgi:hypothetical protein
MKVEMIVDKGFTQIIQKRDIEGSVMLASMDD